MTPEVLARLRRSITNARLPKVIGPVSPNPHPTIAVDLDDLQALVAAHDHYQAEFFHHSGSDMDCDCVELADKWARGEIK